GEQTGADRSRRAAHAMGSSSMGWNERGRREQAPLGGKRIEQCSNERGLRIGTDYRFSVVDFRLHSAIKNRE
ncbi:MAG: hypothetical protein L0Y72_09725, partial [Gemmataceae bacterium]|nr:hypothetical protein [Gemmataceae bacterium]